MTTFARQIVLALCLFTVASSAKAADTTLTQMKTELAARFGAHSDAMKDYVAVNVVGFSGHAYRLADGAARDANQPGVLMFDRSFNLVAIGYARPTAAGVDVMSLRDFNISHVVVAATVAAR